MRVASMVALLFAVACAVEAPFARTNPMDSESNYAITLLGPDSIHSLGERFQLTIAAEPALPAGDYELAWVATPHSECIPYNDPGCDRVLTDVVAVAGEGVFDVIDMRAEYREIYLSVHFGHKHFSHIVMVGQKAAELDLSCSSSNVPIDPCDDVPFDNRHTILLHPRMLDARGHPIVNKVEFALGRGSVFSRDSSIVTPLPMIADTSGVIRLTPLNAGATWVIVNIDEAMDSIRVAVAP